MEEMESAVAVVRRIVCSLLILLGVLAAPPVATAQEKIRLGLLPFSESLGAVIAERQGFFKAEGLDVEVTKFESGALAVPVPGAVAADLPIVLPHPRNQITTRALPQYLDYRGRLLAQLFADEGLVATEPA